MAADTNSALRALIGQSLNDLNSLTHREINEVLDRIGLPAGSGTKHERLTKASASIEDESVAQIGAGLLKETLISRKHRYELQDALWAAADPPSIPARARRDLAHALDLDDLIYDPVRFRTTLGRWWLLGEDDALSALNSIFGTAYRTGSLAEQIEQHVLRNRGDWSVEQLFEKLGAFEAVGTRFARFVEDLASAECVPDEAIQRRIAATVNIHLQGVGYELRETDAADGYPAFCLTATGTARNRTPKNLIFASPTKPDLRFRDALDNGIQIRSNPDEVLVYDRPIPPDGLLWRDLQTWWYETRGSASEQDAKAELYRRLKGALPAFDTSPPQHHLFDAYYDIHRRHAPNLPALLPEVWLHWDPRTVEQRGRDAMFNFRMDFLLLLPHRQRVVIEVDGAHHYSRDGRASPAVYAATMRADRDLKLAGYEVFRFGAADLRDRAAARSLLAAFFTELFRRFGVSPRAS